MQFDETVEWSTLLTALQTQLEQGGSFFAGARLIMDIGDRHVSEQQLVEALDVMSRHGLRPESISARTRESRNAARTAGLATRPASSTYTNTHHHEEALLISRTVRSGQVLQHHGHITLIGDVNPGAQIIAGGNVVVWGRLRGMVHAGALGDTSAIICALELRPTQLRIATAIARTPEDGATTLPEVARIEQDYIIVEAWESFRKVRPE